MTTLPMLGADEHDLLQELFNLGVSQAASALSKIVKQEVILSVPIIELRNRAEMVSELGEDRIICSIRQTMGGPFSAESMLLFPDESGLEVVRLMLGSQLSNETLAELQEEALSEIGNIVLNACIGAISNEIHKTFTVGLPSFDVARPIELFNVTPSALDDVVLLVRISMTLSTSQVTGYMAFILGNLSLNELRKILTLLLKRIDSAA